MEFTSALSLALLVATPPHPAASAAPFEPLPQETPLAEDENLDPKQAVLPLKSRSKELIRGTTVIYPKGSIEERGFAEGYLLADEIFPSYS